MNPYPYGMKSPPLPAIQGNNTERTTASLLEQSQQFYAAIQQSNLNEQRSRQIIEDQVKVITAVCKKLNQDIENLDAQIADKAYQINNLENKTNDFQAQSHSQLKDLQFKTSRQETQIMKLEADQNSMLNSIKDIQSQFQDYNRSIMLRINDIDKRISELNNKFDSVLTEQTMVLKNVEGDTVKQLSLIDGKTRTMLEDVRSQMNQIKVINDSEMVKMESRLSIKIEETTRNSDKFDRVDRKVEDLSYAINKRFNGYEDDYQKNINKLQTSVDKLENKVNKGIEEKIIKNKQEVKKFEGDLKTAMTDIQTTIVTLQKVIEGKIKLSEDRLEKELEKIRKMVVLM